MTYSRFQVIYSIAAPFLQFDISRTQFFRIYVILGTIPNVWRIFIAFSTFTHCGSLRLHILHVSHLRNVRSAALKVWVSNRRLSHCYEHSHFIIHNNRHSGLYFNPQILHRWNGEQMMPAGTRWLLLIEEIFTNKFRTFTDTLFLLRFCRSVELGNAVSTCNLTRNVSVMIIGQNKENTFWEKVIRLCFEFVSPIRIYSERNGRSINAQFAVKQKLT